MSVESSKNANRVANDHEGHAGSEAEGRNVFLLACACAALAYGVAWLLPNYARLAFAIGAIISVLPFAQKAVAKGRRGSPFSIETLVTTAVIGALPIDAGAEAVVVVALFSLGELLEGFAAARARSGLSALAELLPSTAIIEREGKRVEIPVSSLIIGMTVLIAGGDRIPADGIVIDGRSDINEAAITGESRPVAKGIDDQVFAGSINGDGNLRISVNKDAANSVVARIGKLVEEAQESTAPTARFIDSFSSYYTPAAILIAALVALLPPLLAGGDWAVWLYRALTVLLIACPCALVLSTPAAIATGIATAARNGILIKSGAALEALARIRIAAFDKTGTITMGHPVVTDVVGDVLSLAAALETGLAHPVARAIVAEAEKRGIAVPAATDVAIRQGEGVEGMVGTRRVELLSPRATASLEGAQASSIQELEKEGKTVAVLVVDNEIRGYIACRDEPREDAVPAIRALTALGIRALMLSGDNQRTASAVAEPLGIEAFGELMPADKLERINQLKAQQPILMVGDGVNDAPALAMASLGLAMGGGTDVAIETADIGLLKDRLTGVADAIRLARKTRRTILVNIIIAVGLKLVFLVLAVFGITNLWTAILADTGATILVTVNALLLFWTFRATPEGRVTTTERVR